MSMIPREPFRYIEGARREMERFFGSTLFREEPRIDIYEKENEVIASCEMPGLKSKDDLTIEINENILSLSGTIKQEHEIREENVHRQERYWGSFRRSINLPAPVLAEKSRASYRNGILEITMPKADPQPRRKNIQVVFH
ncbi:MAG: Hsp20/alpha crystallin family protein [Firmicutes bacterium]|nr:Hsp20/alpha crystallin family protein [Bacillota bacterium]